MGRASKKGITGDFGIMLRLLCVATTLAVAVIPVVTKIAFSRPISANSQYPEVPKSNNADLPLCYIQTSDGKILDLQKLCGNPPTNTFNKSPSSRVPKAKFRRGSGSGYASDSV